jgi:geranylgeranyl diphosphate synthase type II
LTEDDITRLAAISPGRRVLLLPHCLRHTDKCKAKYNKLGLQCAGCSPDCAIKVLREAAVDLGYAGVCVAPGGRLAVTYISQTRPEAVVAIACKKELEEGVGNVNRLDGDGYHPLIVIIPLSRDGCVDTEVDVGPALLALSVGCTCSLSTTR